MPGPPLHWMPMDNVSAVVIGAGVVGLAVARELAARGHETLILEAAGRFGEGASSRNSEVIHAGIYYPPGSLKARLCVAGRERLYEFCRAQGVAPHGRSSRNSPARRRSTLRSRGSSIHMATCWRCSATPRATAPRWCAAV